MSRGNPPIKDRIEPIDPLRYYPVIQMWSDLQGLRFIHHYRKYQRWILDQLRDGNKYRIKVVDNVRKNKYLMQGIDMIRANIDAGTEDEDPKMAEYHRRLYDADTKIRAELNIK